MARQLTVGTLLLLGACAERPPYPGAFQLPVAAAVLQPEVGGPFEEPIGFVANGHGGAIVPLALKQGRILSDDPTASFLRTNYLATGALRVLSAVAVRATSDAGVEVWAGDRHEGQLLRVPYTLDCAAEPARPECADAVAGAPVEQDATVTVASSPESASLDGVVIKRGYATTETFTITFDGAEWSVVGTRSGAQPNAQTGVAYHTYQRELSFTISGTASPGDQFVVETDNGIEEIDVGGAPLDLKAAPDGSLLAVLVADTASGRPVVRWFDPETKTVQSDVTLAVDAWPTRLAWAEDGALLVADRDHPAIWEVPLGDGAAIEHPTPWPTLDVASLDGDDRRRLYVVPVDGASLWLLDRDTDELIDVNAAAPGAQGMTFQSTVLGIEAIPRRYRTTEFTQDTLRVVDRTVALTLSDQRMVWAHEQTGCLVQDNLGPRTTASSPTALDYTTSFDRTVPGAPTLDLSAATNRAVHVNSCAGIALAEGWEVRFDQNLQAWRVKGAVSGEQAALAYDNVRYLSDDGAISFTIRAGSLPPADGDLFLFTVDPGVPDAIGDTNGDGIPELTLGLGSDPVYFEYRVGLAGAIGDLGGEGWYAEDIRPFTLVASEAANVVARVDPQQAQLEVGWN